MTSKARAKRSDKAVLSGAEPQLFVSDLPKALAYYSDTLGFEIAFSYGKPPFYAQVARDDVKLNIRQVDEAVLDRTVRDREQLLSATVTLDDAETLFREYEAAGVNFHQALRTEPWGARTFVVRDVDGNLILFAS